MKVALAISLIHNQNRLVFFMSEESDLFTPTRLGILRNFWTLLKESKDLEEAKVKYKQLIITTVLNEE